MKKSISAILATFFSFFIFSSASAEWVPMGVGMKDEWGCTKYTLMNARTGEIVTERKCAQDFDSFYARMSSAQKEKAVRMGMDLLTESYKKTRPPERVRDVAMNKFFLAYTGATPS